MFQRQMPKLWSAYEQVRLHGWEGAAHLLRDNLFATDRCWRLKRRLSPLIDPGNQSGPAPREIHVTAGTSTELEKLRATEGLGGWPEDFFADRTYGLRRCRLGFWNGTLAHIAWFAAPGDATTVSGWQPGPGEIEIRNVHTRKAFRGRGLFRHVATAALRDLQAQGITTVYAHVDAANAASLQGFQQLGFVPVAEVLIRRVLGVDRIQTRAATTASH